MHKFLQGVVANPAPGGDVTFCPSTTDDFRLLTFRASLVTSAVVANRIVALNFFNKDEVALSGTFLDTYQTASANVTYNFTGGTGYMQGTNASGDSPFQGPIADLWWPAGTPIKTVTAHLDVADQWEGVVWTALLGEEYEHLRWLEKIAKALGG